jgi:hypothetical protein
VNAKALDRHMNISATSWLCAGVLTVFGMPSLGADADDVSAKPHLSQLLVTRLKAKPCEVLEEIFRATDGSKRPCSSRRKPNGDLSVTLSLEDGDAPLDLMKVGRRCLGGLVAADTRPRKIPRWISYLSVSLHAADEETLDFSVLENDVKEGTDGSIETIGGCGPEMEGRVRFVGGRWHLVGPTSKGCSE